MCWWPLFSLVGFHRKQWDCLFDKFPLGCVAWKRRPRDDRDAAADDDDVDDDDDDDVDDDDDRVKAKVLRLKWNKVIADMKKEILVRGVKWTADYRK